MVKCQIHDLSTMPGLGLHSSNASGRRWDEAAGAFWVLIRMAWR